MTVILTGGCGFIGTNFVKKWLKTYTESLINIDKLTYAANKELSNISNVNYQFIKQDILNKQEILRLLRKYKPRAVIHLAAETHVDRSIVAPIDFVNTNINGTFSLLQATLEYYNCLDEKLKGRFKFLNISTDEVYGSLELDQEGFTEMSPILPSSAYSASKASADLLAYSFYKTYSLPVITTRCSNNFGPFQNEEKFIPKIIKSILSGNKIPIYGKGKQIRDWIFVNDHVDALLLVLERGLIGSIYNIGGGVEITNIQLTKKIYNIVKKNYAVEIEELDKFLEYVEDRAGHDFRYAIQSKSIRDNLGWSPKFNFETALSDTINSYL